MKDSLKDIYGRADASDAAVDDVLGRLGYEPPEQPAQMNKSASKTELTPEEAITGVGSDATPLAQRVANAALEQIPGAESGKTLSEMRQGPEALGTRDTDSLSSAKDETLGPTNAERSR